MSGGFLKASDTVNLGPKMPTGQRFVSPQSTSIHPDGMPTPFFFQPETARRFQSMELLEDDVVLTALPFSGTMWVHKILINLLKVIDDEGSQRSVDDCGPHMDVGTVPQMFVEAMPHDTRPLSTNPLNEEGDVIEDARRKIYGGPTGAWVYDHLLKQPSPRLFLTHLHGSMLPAQLTVLANVLLMCV